MFRNARFFSLGSVVRRNSKNCIDHFSTFLAGSLYLLMDLPVPHITGPEHVFSNDPELLYDSFVGMLRIKLDDQVTFRKAFPAFVEVIWPKRTLEYHTGPSCLLEMAMLTNHKICFLLIEFLEWMNVPKKKSVEFWGILSIQLWRL